MARGRGQHHGDLRAALLGAALQLLAEGGPDDVTLRAVARRAGVSPAAPYHHFPDKAALMAAVALDGFERLAEVQAEVARAAPTSGDEALIDALTQGYVRFALTHRAHYDVMFSALGRSGLESPGNLDQAVALRERLHVAAVSTFDVLADAIADANPACGAQEARRRAVLAWSQAHGAVLIANVATGLDARFDADSLANGAGEAARAIAGM
jgi:AcrR family transcriptional regulator